MSRMFAVVSLFLAAVGLATGSAQSIVDQISAPDSMSAGPNVSSVEAGSSEALNPATAAGVQRTTLEASYLAITGSSAEPGIGHAVNLGATFPFPFAVLSAGARFLTSPFASYDYGTFGGARISIAKDLYPNFYIGAGLNSYFGPSLGLWGTVGAYFLPGDVAFMKNFTVGFSMDGLGKPYTFPDGSTTFGVTPRLSADADIVSTKPIVISGGIMMDAPGFTDFRAGVSAGLTLFDTVHLSGSYLFDLVPTLNGTNRPYPFGFGINVNVNLAGNDSAAHAQSSSAQSSSASAAASPPASASPATTTESGGATSDTGSVAAIPAGATTPSPWSESNINIKSAAGPLSNGHWAVGGGAQVSVGVLDKQPPAIKIDAPATVYASPNFDGVQDDISLPIVISDQRYVQGYRLIITDENGNTVRVIENKEDRPENAKIGTILSRLLYVKHGIPIPSSIRWDGMGSNGSVVPDGTYHYTLEAWDDNGNLGSTRPATVVIDTKKPQADIGAPFLIFAPGGGAPDGGSGPGSPAPDGSGGNSGGASGGTSGGASNGTSGGTSGGTSNSAPGASTHSSAAGNNELAGAVFSGSASFAIPNVWGAGPDSSSTTSTGGNSTGTGDSSGGSGTTTTGSASSGSSSAGTTRLGLQIRQSGSVEDKWTGEILNSNGVVIRSYTWLNAAPQTFTWDGKDQNGQTVPNGLYSYRLTSTDRAGNMAVYQIPNITVLSVPTPLLLSIGAPAFSPNGDGSKDTMTLGIDAVRSVAITRWELGIYDASGKKVRTFNGTDSLPKDVVFDGRDDSGAMLPEADYRAKLSVLYVNGNNPDATSPAFTLDVTAPTAFVNIDNPVFSPDGDGKKDTITFFQDSSKEIGWTGIVRDAAGNAVRHIRFIGAADTTYSWNATDDNGKQVPDGNYTYTLETTDVAGNSGASKPVSFTVDTRPTPVSLSATPQYFSPNADGVNDTVSIHVNAPIRDGVERYQLDILDSKGSTVRSFTGSGALPESISWDGTTSDGLRAPDGTYLASGSVIYKKGNVVQAKSGPITIDTVAPEVKISVDSPVFSPDGDGNRDTITIRQKTSNEGLWKAEITNAAGSAVRTFSWQGTAPDIIWDGRDTNGNVVPDGNYRYVISATDPAGNVGSATIDPIRIDTRPTPVTLRLDKAAFSPNGDGVLDTITFTPGLQVNSDIARWSLTIAPAGGTAVKTWSGANAVPGSFEWDGRTDSGSRATEGQYVASLSVTYNKGNQELAKTGQFALDVTPPAATAQANPTVFSPNGDGRKDQVEITQSGSTEQAWKGAILDNTGTAIRTFSFGARPDSKVSWDGKTDSGQIAPNGVYQYRLFTTDAAGNYGASKDIGITLDVRNTPVGIVSDLDAFSPNGDGIRDSVQLTSALTVTDGIENWQVAVVDANGNPVRTYAGASVPPVLKWDGRTDVAIGANAQGATAPDGVYRARLTVSYLNGNLATAQTRPFTLDNTAPTATIGTAFRIFSPDGDGNRDAVTITQKTSSEDRWVGQVLDNQGNAVRTVEWSGVAPDFVWDGKDDSGNIVPDGVYKYQLSSTDAAGNRGIASIDGFVVDTRKTPVFASTDQRGFSPNADGVADTISFRTVVGLTDGISRWSLAIGSGTGSGDVGTPVKTFSGTAPVPQTITWDGRTDSGSRAPEATYRAMLTIEYVKGNRPVSITTPFVLDVSGPAINLTVSPKPFSPDNDGVDDELTISTGVTDASPIDSWSLVINDPTGVKFNQFSGTGAPASSIVWNGLSSTGELVQSASDYELVMTVRDSLGNVSTAKTAAPVDVLVVRDNGKLKIRISSIVFAPNTADFLNLPADQRDRNIKTLDRLAEILKRYASYNIRIEGYAVMVNYADPTAGAAEQSQILIPLSKARADSIKQALVQRGLDPSRITTVGLGGVNPIVPFSDLENRWKDRRVEFILEK